MNGVKGKALQFDGVSKKVYVSFKSDLNLRQFTLSAWIKSLKISGQTLISRVTANGQSAPWNYRLALTQGSTTSGTGLGDVDFYPANLQPGGSVFGTNVMTDGNWHNLIGVMRGTTIELYVDGKLDSSKNVGFYPDTTSTEPLSLGYSSFSSHAYFEGLMDEVRIYSVPLSAQEISSLYAAYTPTTGIQSSMNHDSKLHLERVGKNTIVLRGLGEGAALVEAFSLEGRKVAAWNVSEGQSIDISSAANSIHRGITFLKIRTARNATTLLQIPPFVE